jgi:hypothetical protein
LLNSASPQRNIVVKVESVAAWPPGEITNGYTAMTKTGQSRKRAALNGDQIAHRAFQLWNAAKRPAGRQSEFWRQAETEFLSAFDLFWS